MDKRITTLKPNVDLIELGDRSITLVGTAHVSRESVELVRSVIEEAGPEAVCVELCEPRFKALREPHRFAQMDIFQVIRTGQAYVLMAQLALASLQKRVGNTFQLKPGAEMIEAVNVAEQAGARVALCDRNVKITLRRAWARASVWSICKMMSSLVVGLFTPGRVTESEIEELKESETLAEAISQAGAYLPDVKQVFIDERDRYLAAKIFSTPAKRIVAVVGAGHVPGIKENLGKEIELAPLEVIPPPSRLSRTIGWGIPTIIIAFIIYGFIHAGSEIGMDMVKSWVLATGALAALGTVLALAHPLTVLSAFLVAPITTLHPLIAAGWICGLVEAIVRKPTVGDLERLGDDITELRGLWKNRVTRILLVMALSNLGGAAGAVLGFTSIASKV